MPRDLSAYHDFQVFLNYPYDDAYRSYAEALSFAVVASGLIPVAAIDLTLPDHPRLQTLVRALTACRYSVHDLARSGGEGPDNLSRMNMPLEMGMALFYALQTQHLDHACAFLVPDAHLYQRFASDLAGLDPLVYDHDEPKLISVTFEWLREVAPPGFRSVEPTVTVVAAYEEFRQECMGFVGSGPGGRLNHGETREVMYRHAERHGWWDWRHNKLGRTVFPLVPLAPNTSDRD
jgi:hypothetical protein